MIFNLATYIHDINPYAVKLWENGPIRWYGVSYLLGFFIGYLLIKRVLRVGISTLKPAQAGDLVVTLALGIVIGGRVGFAVFYSPGMEMLYRVDQHHFPYWQLLALNNGGMSSHGGMIGLIVASWWFARRAPDGPHRMAHVLDLGAFAAPIGLGFGRIANFVNGELYGRAASPTLPWAVKFPQEMMRWYNDPERMAALDKARLLIPRGTLMGPDELVHAIIQRIQDHDAAVTAAVAPLLTPRHPSQLYEALLEGVVLCIVLGLVWMRPRKPLVVGGTFCLAYAVVRIIAECFREPDEGIGYQWLGLTRGQWLSVALGVAGLVIVVVAATRKTEKMGGWWGGEARSSKLE